MAAGTLPDAFAAGGSAELRCPVTARPEIVRAATASNATGRVVRRLPALPECREWIWLRSRGSIRCASRSRPCGRIEGDRQHIWGRHWHQRLRAFLLSICCSQRPPLTRITPPELGLVSATPLLTYMAQSGPSAIPPGNAIFPPPRWVMALARGCRLNLSLARSPGGPEELG